MARPSREAVLGDGPGCVQLIHQFHNGEFLLANREFKTALSGLLMKFKQQFHVRIHHYCFMDSHIHIVTSFDDAKEHSAFMHAVFFRLAQLINVTLKRHGHVFNDRPKTPVIQSGKTLLATMRYLDLNPVRAKMVAKAHHYDWSSYRHYAFGEKNELIDTAPDYEALSRSPELRRKLYRELVDTLEGHGFQRLPKMNTWYFIGDLDWVTKKLKDGGFLRRKKPPG